MLSQRGRYALKAMIRLAGSEEGASVALIAEQDMIPRKFLESIMGDLRRLGLIESRRGKGGGYFLARPAGEITFGEIVRATDGPLALIACASHTAYQRCEDCPDEAACAIRRVMVTVRNEVSQILDRTTLRDAVDGSDATLWPDEETRPDV